MPTKLANELILKVETNQVRLGRPCVTCVCYLPNRLDYVAGVIYADNGEAHVGRYRLLHAKLTTAEELHRDLATLDLVSEPTEEAAARLLVLGLDLQGC
jgi:hypothetical protein